MHTLSVQNVKTDSKRKVSKHMVNSVRAYLVCEHDEPQNEEFVWYGEDCAINMIFDLHNIAQECVERMRENQEMKLTAAEENTFKDVQNVIYVIENFVKKMLK